MLALYDRGLNAEEIRRIMLLEQGGEGYEPGMGRIKEKYSPCSTTIRADAASVTSEARPPRPKGLTLKTAPRPYAEIHCGSVHLTIERLPARLLAIVASLVSSGVTAWLMTR
ncbi:hypothetical protein ACFQ2B_03365 [Streptomyces stramineus]|uniref:Uncharacterized protein n=1 Tax=Streptomyces stramineus TaxID=173861 RepID=A0ABP3KGW4_9ACTN